MTPEGAAPGRAPLLIANRGEIAIRVARTARALGFPTVAVYSDADRFAEHARFCDRAIGIGGEAPRDSYLDIAKVIDAARRSGARYVHPGYGFLSERPAFAEACAKAGLVFVGPTAESMRLMGDKIAARREVDSLEVPRVPGSEGPVKDAREAAAAAREAGYPVLLKAAAGGGGKGMRRVDAEGELAAAFEGASREALGAFGDGSMYVEKFIVDPHHIEVQVFGDGRGGAVHLGARECSVQRRHQKVWEESPAPLMERHPDAREKLLECAVKVARHVKYAGAGTLEFVADWAGRFWFLEMNTRLQVEHPVTEWVTGVDLVAWQLLLAAGELKLPAQSAIAFRGAALEARVYAEDPRTFLPAPGRLGRVALPAGPFVRSDSAFSEAGEVALHYDPMIAKVSAWGATRAEALDRMRVALDETRVEPPRRASAVGRASGAVDGSLRTNLAFLRRLSRHPDVISGDTKTSLIAGSPALTAEAQADAPLEAALAVALHALLAGAEGGGAAAGAARPAGGSESAWALAARNGALR